ncbi:MAG: NAD(P)H-hydrate dehydratase [Promethearchaeota archaeon]
MKGISSEKIPAEEVGILDNNSEWLGIPKTHLMECAGYSFTNEIVDRYKLDVNKKIVIFCGTGNNGGDGFVIARHLSSFGVKSLVILAGSPDKIRTSEAILNWSIISESLDYSVKIMIINDSTGYEEVLKIIKNDKDFSIIVDGLLGTGIKGKIREPISSAIDIINKLKEEEIERFTVVSIDVPSGLDPNTGKVSDKAVKSDLVITFHRNKKGMKENTKYIKKIEIKSIGIPQEAKLFVGKGDFIPTLKSRKIDTHKGQHGKILVIGGSKNYSGAPAYSSLTCINFGIDLVITHTPEVVGDVIRSYTPNMIVRTSPGEWLNEKAFDEISELIEWADTVLIGPGIGLEKKTEDLLVLLINKIKKDKKSLILDADALKLIKDHLELIKGMPVVLTPHEGELKIMTGVELPPYDNIEERSNIILNLAKKLNITLLIKGPYDFISDGKSLKINRTGCPEMSIGGTGDVLAGLCASFTALKNEPFLSACSAAFLNGKIGEYCKKVIGPRFTAMDMIECINETIITLMED